MAKKEGAVVSKSVPKVKESVLPPFRERGDGFPSSRLVPEWRLCRGWTKMVDELV